MFGEVELKWVQIQLLSSKDDEYLFVWHNAETKDQEKDSDEKSVFMVVVF